MVTVGGLRRRTGSRCFRSGRPAWCGDVVATTGAGIISRTCWRIAKARPATVGMPRPLTSAASASGCICPARRLGTSSASRGSSRCSCCPAAPGHRAAVRAGGRPRTTRAGSGRRRGDRCGVRSLAALDPHWTHNVSTQNQRLPDELSIGETAGPLPRPHRAPLTLSPRRTWRTLQVLTSTKTYSCVGPVRVGPVVGDDHLVGDAPVLIEPIFRSARPGPYLVGTGVPITALDVVPRPPQPLT
ncbi:MAG: hypothetical protein JWL58_4351 [Streptosporangiaceae bacterium]|nr:hypothetical protein [Streptosporangiaceae bacterium]